MLAVAERKEGGRNENEKLEGKRSELRSSTQQYKIKTMTRAAGPLGLTNPSALHILSNKVP